MKNIITLTLILTVLISFFGCRKDDAVDDSNNNSNIFYAAVNKEFVLISNVDSLQASNDTISEHVDSIISGLLNEQIISTGLKSFDLNSDNVVDVHFEIIDLNLFNNGNLPSYLDSMAARVGPVNIQVLDNSTYGYPDALDENTAIKETGNWSHNISVIGTFMNAGKFNGHGEKYLAIRLVNNTAFNYGWVKLYCSEHNDTLRIIEYAYNKVTGSEIKAGQKN